MADIEIGINPTATRTQAEGPEFRVGTCVSTTDSAGISRDYMYVSATAANTDVGYIMVVNPVTFAATMLTSTNGLAGIGFPVGSPLAVIPTNGYGWLQIYGPGSARMSAAVVLGSQLNTTATGGALDDTLTATTTAQVAGIAATTATGGAATTTAWFNYPFVLKAQQ